MAVLRLSDRMAEAAEMIEVLTPPTRPRSIPACPRCLSVDSAPIEYGLPFVPECLEWERQGLIWIGGCVVTPGLSPDWHCRACGCEWRDSARQ